MPQEAESFADLSQRIEAAAAAAAGPGASAKGGAAGATGGAAGRNNGAARGGPTFPPGPSHGSDPTSGAFARDVLDQMASLETHNQLGANEQESMNQMLEMAQAMGLGDKLAELFGSSGPLDARVPPFHEEFSKLGRHVAALAEVLCVHGLYVQRSSFKLDARKLIVNPKSNQIKSNV